MKRLSIALMLLAACVSVEGTVAPATAPAPSSAAWSVGAATVDITPPVGYGMAGHAIEARTSVGVWTRLRAHAVAIEDRDGTPVILIATDLWAVSGALTDAVVERLQTKHGLASLGRAQLVLAATHTHHGPGHAHTAPGYADHAGSEPGFDATLFAWLTNRLADAAASAYAARRPATLEHHAVAVPTLARNRSLAPFLANADASALLEANAVLPGCRHPANATPADLATDTDPCHAVDPELTTLVARDANTEAVIAVAGVFGVHATAMPNRTPVYQGDLFGIAARDATDRLARAGHDDAVVALFTGPEGDVSPNWDTQGRGAATLLGGALGEAVVASLDTPGQTLAGTAGYGLARADLSSVSVANQDPGRTGRRALPGFGQFGGAEDGRTRMTRWAEGKTARRPRRRGHGTKRPAMPPPLVALAHPKAHFPSVVPVGVVSLGPLSFVALPGEFTTMMGQRIEAGVSDARQNAGPTVAISLAGDYLSYFTTPQEYDLQHYEGASMMYGRLAGVAVADAAASLAAEPRVEGDGPYRYRGRGRTDHARLLRPLRRRVDDAIPRALEALSVGRAATLSFTDAAPVWPLEDAGPTTPRVVAEAKTAAGWQVVDTDESDRFALVLRGLDGEKAQWIALWLSPALPLSVGEVPLRLRVTGVDGRSTCSAAVTRGDLDATGPTALPAAACASDAPGGP
ncbi:MAG: neutral/alkaline non-lysosomal ceramidase N-terminal domain-containing protein [Myxococcota bacterium]